MTDFSEKLRLKEMAEEDIYFAKRDQELIRALHEKNLAKHLKVDDERKEKQANELQEEYAEQAKRHFYSVRSLADIYRKLIVKALKLTKG